MLLCACNLLVRVRNKPFCNYSRPISLSLACSSKRRDNFFETVSSISIVSNPLLHSQLLSREGPLLSISQTNGKDPSEKRPFAQQPSSMKGISRTRGGILLSFSQAAGRHFGDQLQRRHGWELWCRYGGDKPVINYSKCCVVRCPSLSNSCRNNIWQLGVWKESPIYHFEIGSDVFCSV